MATTLQEAQAQVLAAESQLAQQRTQARIAQEKSAQQLRQLQTAQEKLPSGVSQMALRQKMAGIAGLIKRKAIKKVREKILGQKEKVQLQQKGIETYKKELTKYELEKIAPVKAKIKEAQEYQAAVKRIEKAAAKGKVWALAYYGEGLVQELAQKYMKRQKWEKKTQQMYKDIGEKAALSGVESLTPLETKRFETALKYDILTLKGELTGELNDIKGIQDYNKYIKSLKEKVTDEIIPPTTLPPITEPALVKPTFFQKLKKAITLPGIIPVVSALPRDTARVDKISLQQISKIKEDLSFQSKGKLVLKDAEDFGREINERTGATSFTVAVPIKRQDGELVVQDYNFLFRDGKLVRSKKTGKALIDEKIFLEKDKARSEKLARESILLRDDRDLKRFEPPKVDGLGSITGYAIRAPMVSDSKLGDRISFVDRISTIAKKTFEEDQARFTGAIISAYDPTREVTTYIPPEKTFLQKFISAPTIGLVAAREISERQKALVGAEALIGIGEVTKVSGVDIPHPYTPNIIEIKETKRLEIQANKDYKDFQNLKYVEIPKFESKNRMDGQFDYDSLTKTKQNEYDRLISKTNRAAQKAEDASIRHQDYVRETSRTFKAFGYEKKIPVTQLTSPLGYVGAQALTSIEQAGKGIGIAYEDITSFTGRISKQPFREVGQVIRREVEPGVLLKGKIEPDVVYDFLTGEARVPTKKDITPGTLTFVQPEEVGKVATGVFRVGAYALPGVGAGIFAAEVGEELSQVGYDPLRFVKEKPVQAAFLGGALLGLGALKGSRYLRTEARLGRQIAKVQRAEPEIFLGLEKGLGDTSTLLIGARRQAGRLRAETLTKFDVLQIGKKTFQVQKGVGAQRISKEMRFFRDYKPLKETEFTFFGEAKEVAGRVVRKEDFLGLIKEIKKPISPVYSEVQILTRGEKTELLKSFGVGLQKTEKEITKVLSFPVGKRIKLKTGEIRIIDLPSGKEKIVDIFGAPKVRVDVRDLEAIGVIKKIKGRVEPKVVDIGGFQLKTIAKAEKKVGEAVGLQIETRLLQPPRIKVKPTKEITPIISTQEIVTIQQPFQVSIPLQPALIERPDVLQVPKVTPGVGVLELQVTKQRDVLALRPTTKLGVLERPTTRVIPKVITGVRVSQISRVGQITRIRQVPRARQITETITGIKVTPTVRPRVKPRVKPKIRIFPLGKEPKKVKRIIPKKRKEEEEFLAITKRYGRDIIVGRGEDPLAVIQTGKKFVRETLAASLKLVTRKGRQIQLTPGKFFRVGKTDPFSLIQRKERRLKAVGERREIIRARKAKPRKIKKKVIRRKKK